MTTRKFGELVLRNEAVIAELPAMSPSDKFALLESLEAERATLPGLGEAKLSLDLHRVVEQDLWSWGMRAAFDEREESHSRKRKPLAEYLLPQLPLADQLKAIADDLSTISAGDRFSLLQILNERAHGRAKPAEQLMFMNLLQLTRQSLWGWMTQQALVGSSTLKKKRSAVNVAAKAEAASRQKPVAKKAAAKKAPATKAVTKSAKKPVKKVVKNGAGKKR